MNTRITAVVAGALVCLTTAVRVAEAQAPCTAQAMTGTYALSARGSSTILDPLSHPYPYHWAGALAPFAAIGQVTIDPSGLGRGYYWISIGSLTAGLDPFRLEATVTELNPDCTGKWQYVVDLFGTPVTIEERFILFDNGREFRSIPTVTGVPAMAWVGEGHRISKPSEPLDTCGPQTAKGTYVAVAENLVHPVWLGPNPVYSDTLLMRFDVSMSGEFTGTLFEKLGPKGDIESPIWGTMTVHADCSFEATLNLIVHGTPATAPLRGVFFDQGQQYYVMGVRVSPGLGGIQYSFGQGQRTRP
jgi:hypothetical protein